MSTDLAVPGISIGEMTGERGGCTQGKRKGSRLESEHHWAETKYEAKCGSVRARVRKKKQRMSAKKYLYKSPLQALPQAHFPTKNPLEKVVL